MIKRVKVKAVGGYAHGHATVDYKPMNNKPPKDWDAGEPILRIPAHYAGRPTGI